MMNGGVVMAKANYFRGTIMFEKFKDYWSFIQNFGIVENTDEYWATLMDAANNLANKYNENGKDLFLRDLILAFIDEKEREIKLQKNNL